MALVKNFPADRDKQVRRDAAGHKAGCGQDKHMLTGPVGSTGTGQDHYRSLIRFLHDWSGVQRIVKAEIAVKVEDDSTHFSLGSKAQVHVARLTSTFAEGANAENVWTAGEYEWPNNTGAIIGKLAINPATGKPQDGAWLFIDVTSLIKPIVPKTVLMPDGTAGGGGTNFGWLLRNPGNEAHPEYSAIFFSDHATNSGDHPYLRLTYDPANRQPSAPILTGPATVGNSFGDSFEGQHVDPDLDPMAARYIEVREKGKTAITWFLPSNLQSAGSDESLTGLFSVPLSLAVGSLKLQTAYEWRAATKDSRGLPASWKTTAGVDIAAFSPWRDLRITSSAPTIVATNVGASVSALANENFGGVYSDPESNPLAQFQLQMQPVSAQTDAAFADPATRVWDTGETIPTLDEITRNVIERPYAGQPLAVGTYTYRIRAQDSTGVWSAWSYDDWTLTTAYDTDVGNVDLTTQIARNAPVRVALFAMGPDRGPGALIGYIDDPTDLGSSGYLNGGGEMYFSLPALHPYCPSIEPHQTHYAVEQWYGDRFRTLPEFSGLITDFDADAETVTFYGTNYVGLLQTAVDERYNPANAEVAAPTGSKYTNQTIDAIIRDQLTYHKNLANSPVAFINIGTLSALAERATIYSTYVEALPFINGLIDSHKQGTGREARFYARQATTGIGSTSLAAAAAVGATNIKVASVSNWAVGNIFRIGTNDVHKITAVGTVGSGGTGITFTGGLTWGYPTGTAVVEQAWEWTLVDPWGHDRPNIRLEYGGLLNDFRVVALGDFGTRVLAVGQKRGEVKVYRKIGVGGLTESLWGRRAKTAFFQDIIDQNDLQRRANEAANQLSKIGKRMALAIQADALAPFDGWDVGDSIVIDIVRGVVDTSRYGSLGLWTVYGVEWRYHPDGHTELTLTVLPKKSVTAAPPDLIGSINPGVPIQWQVGYGVPTDFGSPPDPTPPPAFARAAGDEVTALTFPLSDDPVNAKNYQDLNTGCVYELDESTMTYTEVYCPPTGGGGTPYVPDTTPPPVITIKSLDPLEATQQPDGTTVAGLQGIIGYATPPVGLDDLSEIVVQSTRYPRVDDPSQPDWTLATQWTVASTDKTGTLDTPVVQPNVLAGELYWWRASATDEVGNRQQTWSAIVSVTAAADADGPPQPSGIVTAPGMGVIGVRWSPILAPDFAYTEVQIRTASPVGSWVSLQTGGTIIVLTNLVNGTTYDIRLRSVDTSGNTADAAGNTFTVADHPDDGWTTIVQATPTAAHGDDLIWDPADVAAVFATGINADWINAGTLHVGGRPSSAAQIEVYNIDSPTPHLIGRWDENGITIFDPDPTTGASRYQMKIDESSLIITDLLDPAHPFDTVTINPLGIDAASITFGSARGGHNLVPNSSFEMGAFPAATAPTTLVSTWTVAADWNAAGSRQGADVNVTTGANDLTMTAVT